MRRCFNILPLAKLERKDREAGPKHRKLLNRERFGKDIGKLILARKKRGDKRFGGDPITYKVIVNIDVLGASMQYGIGS